MTIDEYNRDAYRRAARGDRNARLHGKTRCCVCGGKHERNNLVKWEHAMIDGQWVPTGRYIHHLCDGK